LYLKARRSSCLFCKTSAWLPTTSVIALQNTIQPRTCCSRSPIFIVSDSVIGNILFKLSESLGAVVSLNSKTSLHGVARNYFCRISIK